jgi:hypothetical protein
MSQPKYIGGIEGGGIKFVYCEADQAYRYLGEGHEDVIKVLLVKQ